MEPTFPDFPWQPRQQLQDLPEAQFIYAIILAACEDSNKRFHCPRRQFARYWFYGAQFRELCDVVGIDHLIIRKQLRQHWRNNGNKVQRRLDT
ncbi:MAG: hypothetical protein U1E78_11950 [Gammaproteobacteria bacterium]